MRRKILSARALATAFTLGVAMAGLLAASHAKAVETDPQCVASEANEMAFCKAVCQANFKTAKDLCRNIDHDCAETCRAGLEGCLDGPNGPLTQLDACRIGCADDLESAVTNCRNTTTIGTPERDQCVDAAQVLAFQCRDTCREGVATGLRQCRDLLKGCIQACPPS
jgi:hypothetical protein